MFLQHPRALFLYLSFFSSVSQLAGGCGRPHNPSWQQFTFWKAHVKTSVCYVTFTQITACYRWLSVAVIKLECAKYFSAGSFGQTWHLRPETRICSADEEDFPLSHPRAANRSDQFPHISVCRKHCALQRVTSCFSSSLLCTCVPISSTVQVEALGVVSMDTKQLAAIQNRTWRVAYLQALGARKS